MVPLGFVLVFVHNSFSNFPLVMVQILLVWLILLPCISISISARKNSSGKDMKIGSSVKVYELNSNNARIGEKAIRVVVRLDQIEYGMVKFQSLVKNADYNLRLIILLRFNDNNSEFSSKIQEKGLEFKEVTSQYIALQNSKEILKFPEFSGFTVLSEDLNQLSGDVISKILVAINSEDDVLVGYARKGKQNIMEKIVLHSSHFLVPQTRQLGNLHPDLIAYDSGMKSLDISLPIENEFILPVLLHNQVQITKSIDFNGQSERTEDKRNSFKSSLADLLSILKLAKYRPIKFLIVGIIGVVVNEGMLALLHTYSHDLEIISLISIELSILSNYLLNAFWTFRDRSTKEGSFNAFSMKELLKYNLVALGGLMVNIITLVLLTSYGIEYLDSNLVGIVLGFILNYIGSEKIVWKFKGN